MAAEPCFMRHIQINQILAEQEWEFLFPLKPRYVGIQFAIVDWFLKMTMC